MGGEYGGGGAQLTAQEPVGEPGDVGLVVRAFQHADVASYSVHSVCEGGEILLEGADVCLDSLEPDGHLEELVGEDVAAQGLLEYFPHITEMVGNFAAHLTRDEMAYGAQERGLNWGSIRAPDELVDEGHLNDRGFWVEVPHPERDRSFKYPGPAGIYNGSPWRISRRAPLIGEHNEEIYCGELGLQRTELAYLAESGVV